MEDGGRGVAVHVYADHRRGSVFIIGRLEDGRSFAAEDSAWRPTLYARAALAPSARPLGLVFEASAYRSLEGGALVAWRAPSFGSYRDAVESLGSAGVPVHGSGGLAELYRADRSLGLGVRVRGEPRPGRRVDLVLANAAIEADDGADAPLSVLSLDIETDETDRSVRAASLSMADWKPGAGRLERRPGSTVVLMASARRDLALSIGSEVAGRSDGSAFALEVARDEESLLADLARMIVSLDPDIVTGWNVVDFDLARLVERAEAGGRAFDIGRSSDGAKVLPKGKGRTATAIVAGRQVVDAMRVARSGPERYEDYALETVARSALGRGKGVSLRGAAKLAELDRLYRDEPEGFASYAAEDAALVLDVLDATGLFALTAARARLVGIGLDRAWTSVAAFERAYGQALLERGVKPPPADPARSVSGAAGGTVLPAKAGYREGVVVLDFKSLYPSVIRTFGIDPMARALALAEGVGRGDGAVSDRETSSPAGGMVSDGREDDPGVARSGGGGLVVAPNGARFAAEREGQRWPLPALVDAYMTRREKAMASGDSTGSYVYKILMNSFYGVLGTPSCRYAHTELAGAVTSFGRLVLLRAKARIEDEGSEVLYGDTDSLFVATGLGAEASYAAYRGRADALCALVNEELARMAEREYGTVSRLELRFDKAYARLVIPPLRVATAPEAGVESPDDADDKAGVEFPAIRGRSKGYAGLLRGPAGDSLDVKGMEAVRSDWTPLARDFQRSLLSMAFAGANEGELGSYIEETLRALRAGQLDAGLVYTRTLRRSEAAYVKSTPPHVKAARLAGLSGRGTVSYVIAKGGPAPVDRDAFGSPGNASSDSAEAKPDYDHYIQRQLSPIAHSLAASGLAVPVRAFAQAGMQPELF